MLSRLTGTLVDLQSDAAEVALGPVVVRILLPSFVASRLGGSIGQPVTLHTLAFLESQDQGSTFLPRVAGFTSPQDRAFFELFVSCKGIGRRKALRALALPPAQIAAAIVDRDAATLQSLPEIGKRTAETIIVTLKGKVEPFLEAPASPSAPSTGVSNSPASTGGGLTRGALEALLQLGETRVDAVAWIDRAMGEDDPPTSVEDLLAAVYRLKAGG